MWKRTLALLFVVLVVLAAPLSLSQPLRDRATTVLQPVIRPIAARNQAVYDFFRNIRQVSSLREDKNALQLQVVELQKQLSEQDAIRRENEFLREELSVNQTTQEISKVLARVIIQGNNPLNRTLTIDAGSALGIREGQAAVAHDTLIGRVIAVREHSAVIRTVNSPESLVQAWVVGNRERGLLVGDGNNLVLKDVNQGVEIVPGSLVETSGLGGSLPQGIRIGTVESLQSKTSNLSQSFTIKQDFRAEELSSLFVLLTEPS